MTHQHICQDCGKKYDCDEGYVQDNLECAWFEFRRCDSCAKKERKKSQN